jgi:hypothetical protein
MTTSGCRVDVDAGVDIGGGLGGQDGVEVSVAACEDTGVAQPGQGWSDEVVQIDRAVWLEAEVQADCSSRLDAGRCCGDGLAPALLVRRVLSIDR